MKHLSPCVTVMICHSCVTSKNPRKNAPKKKTRIHNTHKTYYLAWISWSLQKENSGCTQLNRESDLERKKESGTNGICSRAPGATWWISGLIDVIWCDQPEIAWAAKKDFKSILQFKLNCPATPFLKWHFQALFCVKPQRVASYKGSARADWDISWKVSHPIAMCFDRATYVIHLKRCFAASERCIPIQDNNKSFRFKLFCSQVRHKNAAIAIQKPLTIIFSI